MWGQGLQEVHVARVQCVHDRQRPPSVPAMVLQPHDAIGERLLRQARPRGTWGGGLGRGEEGMNQNRGGERGRATTRDYNYIIIRRSIK